MKIRNALYHFRENLKKRRDLALHGSCRVLLYHRVTDLANDPQRLCVTPARFHEQLSGLKRTAQFIGIEEFCDILGRGSKFPKNACMITFDDGYADNHKNALPVLANLGLQAVFYVATANLGTNRLFWWDEVDLMFADTSNGHALRDIALSTGESLPAFYARIISQCKSASSLEAREQVLDGLRSRLNPANDVAGQYRCMTEDELLQLAGSPSAVIGAHTVNHLSLGHLSEENQRYEISASAKALSHILGKEVRHFAFPYGEHVHYAPATMRICRELGFRSAAANFYETVTVRSDLYAFPRLIVRNDSYHVLYEQLKQVAP